MIHGTPRLPDGTDPDVIVIGAGHNALVAACYLCLADLRVLVLEARDIVGGATVHEELTLPGFIHDTFSTGHFAFQDNPILTDPRIDLAGRGLRYLTPDPVLVMPLPGGDSLTIHLDDDATAREFARHDLRDGEAWLKLVADWGRFAGAAFDFVSRPAGSSPMLDPQIDTDLNVLRARSAWDVVHERFHSPAARNTILFIAAATGQELTAPGTGALALQLPYVWSRVGWPHPEGGAGALPDALASFVRDRGGEVRTGAYVRRIVLEKGRATGIILEDGTRIRAGSAVLSNMHIKTLPEALPDDALPQAFVEGVRRFRPGHSVFVVHLALASEPRIKVHDGLCRATLCGSQTLQGMRRQFEIDLDAGKLSFDPEHWFFAACSSVVDPSRAPEGRAVVKMMTIAPYALAEGTWSAIKDRYADLLVANYARLVDGFRPGEELVRLVVTPEDIEAINPHLHHGTTQGGEMVADQLGIDRPVRGWSDHRSPVQGLYLTGTTTHPGSPVSGWPGRHAAAAILGDLGYDAAAVLGPRRSWSVGTDHQY